MVGIRRAYVCFCCIGAVGLLASVVSQDKSQVCTSSGACPQYGVQSPKSSAEVAADLLASDKVTAAVRLLSELQGAQPTDREPIQLLHRGLLASAQNNTSGHFDIVRREAISSFDDVLYLISLAAPKVQLREVQDLRYAYQQLQLPAFAAKLGEVVALDFPGLPQLDRAEILLESGRLADAESAYTSLLESHPDNSHVFAQLTRLQAERQAQSRRLELLQTLTSDDPGSVHWALKKPSTFTKVERRNAADLSYSDFYTNFTLARKPLILTGCDLYRRWDWEWISRVCGEVPVVLQAPVRSDQSVSWAGLRTLPGEVRLADWIDHVRKDLPNSADDGFVFDFGLTSPKRGCPKLLETFSLPRFFTNDVFKRLPPAQRALDPFENSPGLFVQPSQSTSALHVDALDSHFLQILLEGRKRWTFYALEPERQQLLLARKLTYLIKENGPGIAREARWSELIGADGTNSTNRLLDFAEAHRVEVTLEKGELLFVPGGVPHQVTQLAPSLAISLNYVDHSNFEAAVNRLLWLANFTQDDGKRKTLIDLLRNPPSHKVDPADMLWSDLVGL